MQQKKQSNRIKTRWNPVKLGKTEANSIWCPEKKKVQSNSTQSNSFNEWFNSVSLKYNK